MGEMPKIRKILQRVITFSLSLAIAFTSIPINQPITVKAVTGDNGELKVNANGTVTATALFVYAPLDRPECPICPTSPRV